MSSATPPAPAPGWRRLAVRAYLVVAWIFVACLVIQVFLAGLGVFAGAENFATHREFGYVFGLLTIALIVLAVAARQPATRIGLGVLVLVLFIMQSVFVVLRDGAPALAALHPVNGFAILWLSIWLAQRAGTDLRSQNAAVARA